MKRIIRKALSGKTMAVAGTFTGAIACVAAFTPAATAAPIRPAIEEGHCGTGQSTWVHIKTYNFFDCVGFRGRTQADDSPMIGECGGNNYGHVYSYSGANSAVFGPGKTYRSSNRSTWGVSIEGWTGTDECPL